MQASKLLSLLIVGAVMTTTSRAALDTTADYTEIAAGATFNLINKGVSLFDSTPCFKKIWYLGSDIIKLG